MQQLEKWVKDLKASFTEDELDLIENGERPSKKEYEVQKYLAAEEEYFARISGCKLDTKTTKITVAKTCSDLIYALFKKYATADTFVLTSSKEHDHVREKFNPIPENRKIQLDILDDNEIDFLIQKIKDSGCTKLFIYYLVTEISTGIWVPQQKFIKLFEKLENAGIPYVSVIDDCQGMFWIPRNYSIFDYVLSTAHSNLLRYAMGICISKMDAPIVGEKISNWLEGYIPCLDIFLTREKTIYKLRDIIISILKDKLDSSFYKITDRGDRRFLSIKLNKSLKINEEDSDILDNNDIDIEGNADLIRIRCHQFINFPDNIITGITLLLKVLKDNQLTKVKE